MSRKTNRLLHTFGTQSQMFSQKNECLGKDCDLGENNYGSYVYN